MKPRTLENRLLALTVDALGRIVSLRNKQSGSELIAHPDVAEAWRAIIPTGRHTIDIVHGSKQKPAKIELRRDNGRQTLVISYDELAGSRSWPVRLCLTVTLDDDAPAITAVAEVESRSDTPVDELEFPVIGGLGGFRAPGRKHVLDLVAAGDRGNFHAAVLERGLPDTGRESNHYVREHETAMFEADGAGGVWLDVYGPREGLFIGYGSAQRDFALKIEKHPKEVPNAPAHSYPPGTPRWLRISAVHAPQVPPGATWRSEPVEIMPHAGDWHAGADRYAAYRHQHLKIATPPAWMDDFVGWTEILGKTYLGEVYHDYAQCADAVVKDARVTGLDMVFYYGHSRLGAEGADFDHAPAPDLGGEDGFRAMVDKLHAAGVRIILLDHFHRYINRDVPEYEALRLVDHAVHDADGELALSRWWKETFLSCRRLAGPTPVWVEMCPSSRQWLEHYLAHIENMVALGVDGLELDCFDPGVCWNRGHDHPPGVHLLPAKIEFTRAARARAKALNPDFVLIGETMTPETREVLDGYYPGRYLSENDRIYRYLFPELRQQPVLVGNYAYDQVNKALCLGIGVETEIWGLRKTTLAACPELARYIGEVNRFRRKHADVMIRGKYRDTVGANVEGNCLYSVLEGPDGSRAVVLRNPHPRPVRLQVVVPRAADLRWLLSRPFGKEMVAKRFPVRITLKPYEAAILFTGADSARLRRR